MRPQMKLPNIVVLVLSCFLHTKILEKDIPSGFLPLDTTKSYTQDILYVTETSQPVYYIYLHPRNLLHKSWW